MKKRNLIFPLFISSFFIHSIKPLESETFLNLYGGKIISYQEFDLPIAFGGGGVKTPEERKKECIKNSKRSIEILTRELIKKEDEGELTEKTKNKINKYKKILSECDGKNKRLLEENIKPLTKREARKFAIKIINQKIKAEKNKSSNIDLNANYEEWVDQLKKIKDNIEVLEFLKVAFSRYEYTEQNIGNAIGSIDKLKKFGIELILYYSASTKIELIETVEKLSELTAKAEQLSLTKNNEIKKLIIEINSALFLLEIKKFQ